MLVGSVQLLLQPPPCLFHFASDLFDLVIRLIQFLSAHLHLLIYNLSSIAKSLYLLSLEYFLRDESKVFWVGSIAGRTNLFKTYLAVKTIPAAHTAGGQQSNALFILQVEILIEEWPVCLAQSEGEYTSNFLRPFAYGISSISVGSKHWKGTHLDYGVTAKL